MKFIIPIFYWIIFNILCYEIQIIASSGIEDIIVEVKRYQNTSTLQMKIHWNWNTTHLNRTNLDVTITPKHDKYCPKRQCHEYGLSKDLDEIILPRDPNPLVEHKDDCEIKPGCTYNVTVMTTNRKSSRSMAYTVPNCVQKICSCKHDSLLPKPIITAELQLTTSIYVNWSVTLIKSNEISLSNDDIILGGIYIRINQHKNPHLSWGGVARPLKAVYVSFNSSEVIIHGGYIKGQKIFNMGSTILPETKYQIFARIVDNFNCLGSESHFLLIVPAAKTDLHQSTHSSHSIFISIVVPSVLLILAAICVFHYIYKNFKKSTASNNWMSIYRNTSTGNVRPIQMMEESPIYNENEILENSKIDIYEIPRNNIKIIKEIGGGAFGRVFEATAYNLFGLPGSATVAVKQLKKKLSPIAVEEFLGEIQTMKNAGRNENVVELLGYCTTKEPLMMIMEYVRYGDLLRYLKKVREKHHFIFRQKFDSKLSLYEKQESLTPNSIILPEVKYLELKHSITSEDAYITQPDTGPPAVRPSITETTYTMLSEKMNEDNSVPALDYVVDNKELHNFAIQIAKGMKHLEEKGITHRDLAARNVLIDEGKVLKISDFGLSRPGIYINNTSRELPLRWLSLEAIRDRLYSSKSDVWAFAIVLWEIGTLGGFPYPTVGNYELLSFLSRGDRLEKPEICSDVLYALMLECWDENPMKRPSFKEIVDRLFPQNQKIYVEFSNLGPDYVFPPTKDEVFAS